MRATRRGVLLSKVRICDTAVSAKIEACLRCVPEGSSAGADASRSASIAAAVLSRTVSGSNIFNVRKEGFLIRFAGRSAGLPHWVGDECLGTDCFQTLQGRYSGMLQPQTSTFSFSGGRNWRYAMPLRVAVAPRTSQAENQMLLYTHNRSANNLCLQWTLAAAE